jgi:malonyl-CoA decarboxylase
VAAHLSDALGIEAFSTLSPLRRGRLENATGFAQWLEKQLAAHDAGSGEPLFTRDEMAKIGALPDSENHTLTHKKLQSAINGYTTLSAENQQFITQLMKDLGQYYLVHEKSQLTKDLPLDPVANFHLGNGAKIANIHWLPPQHTTRSETVGGGGLMVNYRYEPIKLAIRKQHYIDRQTVYQSNFMQARYDARMAALGVPINCVAAGTIESENVGKIAAKETPAARGGA